MMDTSVYLHPAQAAVPLDGSAHLGGENFFKCTDRRKKQQRLHPLKLSSISIGNSSPTSPKEADLLRSTKDALLLLYP